MGERGWPGGSGSTVGIPSSTCKNVLTVRTQTQTQLSTASMREAGWAGRGSRSGSWRGEQGLLLQHWQLLAEASLKRCGNGSGNNATVHDDDAGQIVERPCECIAFLGSSRSLPVQSSPAQTKWGLALGLACCFCLANIGLVQPSGWMEAGRPVGFSDDRSARFCKTFNCNLRSNWQGGKGSGVKSQGLLLLLYRIYCFQVYRILAALLPPTPTPPPSKCRTRRLSVATAIEEFHFETFNFQRAMATLRCMRREGNCL